MIFLIRVFLDYISWYHFEFYNNLLILLQVSKEIRLDDILIKNALAMRRLGGMVARQCTRGIVIYLQGSLGVGKTTFVRGFLKKLKYTGRVNSPTFSLLEIYQINDQVVCHFDLYRLKQPEELLYIGISDFFNEKNICLVEWPDKGKGFLPIQDLFCRFNFVKKCGLRMVQVIPNSISGEDIVKQLKNE
ncbi:MAG: tRNA (adenosine(37)-N6)-threonylcarbamoyltransferase complex ATPase subunit type 1 TsaE [Coxiellaceae bacterium]|jgi:tRNA threonylcarbamoyladenosine biosynthesis protein TsaE|nr:tRNA (adenosine(37)-N6)-threonylcarbamoyltransferase complex ATPase subunit type 1 TsaE [Coxiellaceae bacterium]